MTVPVNTGTFFKNQFYKSATEKTSRSVTFVGVNGAIFYLLAETFSGTYKIEIKLFDTWHTLTEGTCEAGVLSTIDVEFFFPEARIKFTPSNPGGTFSARVFGYPAVYTKDVQGDLY